MAMPSETGIQGGMLVVWTLTESDPAGEPVNLSVYPNKTVMIEGGQARLMGAMRSGGEAVEVVDAQGFPLKSGLSVVAVNPVFLAPVLISGDPVRVTIVATKGGF